MELNEFRGMATTTTCKSITFDTVRISIKVYKKESHQTVCCRKALTSYEIRWRVVGTMWPEVVEMFVALSFLRIISFYLYNHHHHQHRQMRCTMSILLATLNVRSYVCSKFISKIDIDTIALLRNSFVHPVATTQY